MDTAKAKDLFQNGLLKSARLIRAPMQDAWTIEITMTSGRSAMMVTARAKELKIVKDLRAAVKALEEIGFRVDALDVTGLRH